MYIISIYMVSTVALIECILGTNTTLDLVLSVWPLTEFVHVVEPDQGGPEARQ